MASEYVFAWQEKSSVLIGLGHQIASQRGGSDIFPIPFRNHLVYFDHTQTHVYYAAEDIQVWEAQSKLFLEPNYLSRYLNATKQYRNAFHQAIQAIQQTNLNQARSTQLWQLFNDYYEAVVAIQGIYLATQPEGVYHVDIELRKLLKQHCPAAEIESIYSVLCTAYEFDITQREKIDWYALIQNSKPTDKQLMEHAKTYPAFFFNTYSWPAIIEYLRNRQANEDVVSLKTEIAQLYTERDIIKQERDRLLKSLPQKVIDLSEILRALSVDRFEMKNCWSGAELLALDLLLELSKRLQLNISDFMAAYTSEDIHQFLQTGKKLSETTLKERKDFIFYQSIDQINQFLSGKTAALATTAIFGDRQFSQDSVTGMVANIGKVSGKARVVLVEDIESFMKASDEFESGDILITTMTSPNMVLLMKRAAAVVTNEGGVCSHAAVVSREMKVPRKKPCIVGTKDATRIFKTGDYVLVDGNTGNVTKVTKQFHLDHIQSFEQALEVKPSSLATQIKVQPNAPLQKTVVFLQDLSAKDILSVGGKGANLGELYKHFTVPNAFCITTFAYNQFRSYIQPELDQLLTNLNYDDSHSVQATSQHIQELILGNPLPRALEIDITKAYATLGQEEIIEVSVRSSATAEDLPEASFAGQQDTFLNVLGIEQILTHIKECFASLYTHRAILYRHENKISEQDLSMSVVVQVMVDVDCAGVAFSVNPITGNRHELIIDAAPGVGENVVSGKVTPDHYTYDKNAHIIQQQLANQRSVLSENQVIELAKVVLAIEKHFEYPQDVEWAIDKQARLHILQSRPITTL